MKSCGLRDAVDIQTMRELIARVPDGATMVDFEEKIQLADIRATIRLWEVDDQLIAFAYVDNYNNLWFVSDPVYTTANLESEIVDWGVTCIRTRNAETGETATLDTNSDVRNTARLALLERYGFRHEPIRSLSYECALNAPIPNPVLPPGFTLRCVHGEEEVAALVALHQAAFGTTHMTVEERLAIMRAPQYDRELDFVVVALNGELAAFCICGIEEDSGVGYTDPIGTHPNYQKQGLGKAVVTAGLRALHARGVKIVTTGTSSEDIAMQRLATALGFVLVAEKMWFSKEV